MTPNSRSYLNHFTQPDTIVPDPYNSQDWDRYSYARNNPLQYNDPSGHWPNWIGSAWDSYMLGWSNFGTAVSILQDPKASFAAKAITGTYAAAWGGAHLALGVGAAGVACGLTPTCAVTAEAGLGIGGAASADGDPTNEINAIAESAKSVSDKLSRYLLNPEHAEGSSKAEWFKRALGYTEENMADLAKQIVFHQETAMATELTEHGQKYEQLINIVGMNGKSIDVLFVWIRNADGVVRLVTSIPTKR